MTRLTYVAILSRTSQGRSDRVRAAIEVLRGKHGFATLYESPTITLLAPAPLPHLLLGDGSGVILGPLFDRDGKPARADQPGLAAPPGDFVERYWGGYLALRTRHAAPEILRDPSGFVPCFHAELDRIHFVTSQARLLVDAGIASGAIDWKIVTQALVYRDLRPAATALVGIDEIQPGMAGQLLPPGLALHCAWTPWRFTTAEREIHDFARAQEAVGEVTRRCVGAWGALFARPLVEISGGLDSAIVAAALSGTGKTFHGVTFAAVEGDPDETPYARAIASFIGVGLSAIDPDVAGVDLRFSEAGELPRHNARSFAQALDRPEQAVAQAHGADGFFGGGGGDNVFCFLRSTAPLIDRLRREGPGPGIFATAGDIAALAGVSPWTVLWRSAIRLLRRRPPPAWMVDTQFLTAAATDGLAMPDSHPWLAVPAGMLPGKRAHVMALIRVQNHLDAHGRGRIAPIVFPLLSQPVMETCLSIPSWLWCQGGKNRAVARAAFAGALPPEVIARQSKGAFDSFCARIFEANRAALKTLLLDGQLAQQGLIDRDAVARALADPASDGMAGLRLLSLADAESWARAWADRATSPGSAVP